MDIKTFVLGALTGIAASGLIYWLIDGRQGRSISVDPSQHAAIAGQDSRRVSDQTDQATNVARPLPAKTGQAAPSLLPVAREQGLEPPDVRAGSPDRSRDLENSEAATSKHPEESDDKPSENAAETSLAERADRAREKEPKDSSWSYYMEQTLRQYLASHPKAAQFDFTSIDCRTTFCQVQAVGFDESTDPVWHQVVYDVRQQPWNEFFQHSSSSGPWEGRWLIVGTLHRRPSQ